MIIERNNDGRNAETNTFFSHAVRCAGKYLGYHKNSPYTKTPTRINIAEYQHIHATLTAYFLNFGDNSSTSCACNNLLNLTITAFMGANLDMRTPCSSKMKIILYLKYINTTNKMVYMAKKIQNTLGIIHDFTIISVSKSPATSLCSSTPTRPNNQSESLC